MSVFVAQVCVLTLYGPGLVGLLERYQVYFGHFNAILSLIKTPHINDTHTVSEMGVYDTELAVAIEQNDVVDVIYMCIYICIYKYIVTPT